MKIVASLIFICSGITNAMIEIPLERRVDHGAARHPAFMMASIDSPIDAD